MRDVEPLKAVVREGRLILDVPTDLPEGTEVELVVVDDVDAELLEELEASERDEAAGDLADLDAVISRLGTKPREVASRLASPKGELVWQRWPARRKSAPEPSWKAQSSSRNFSRGA